MIPLIIISYVVVEMSSKPKIDISDKKIDLKIPMCALPSIEYKDITHIEYLNYIDFGEKRKERHISLYTQQY